jgi:ferric-dicitrate binding protein FerR (iron transport regulator)
MNQRKVIDLILLVIFVLFEAGVVWGMFQFRRSAVDVYGTSEGQQEWERWRSDVAKQSEAFDAAEKGLDQPMGPLPPVKRRVSKSAEPPALVLMRDQFVVCLAGAMLLSGAMFGSILLLLRGALVRGGAAKEDDSDEEENLRSEN